MKKLLLLFAIIMLIACVSRNTNPKDETSYQLDTISINEKKCYVYDIGKLYFRVETSEVLTNEDIGTLMDTLKSESFKDKIVYFHIFDNKDRGYEYATWNSGMVVYSDIVVRNKFDQNHVRCENELEYFTTVTNIDMSNLGYILGYLKNVDKLVLLSEDYASTADEKKQLLNIKKKFAAHKSRLFPIMREAYYLNIKEKMWAQDIDVKRSGKTLYFYGGVFFANQNKLDYYHVIADLIKDLRFNKVCFGPYEGGEYTYWTVYSGADTDI